MPDGLIDRFTCVICMVQFDGYGHTTEPIRRGRCCNRCNDQVIIPARIRAMRKEREVQHGNE